MWNLHFYLLFSAFTSGYTERKISEYSRVVVETSAIRNHSLVLIEPLPSQSIDLFRGFFQPIKIFVY